MENTELAKLVLKQVEAFPEQFDMNVWAWETAACGTTACLAGWTLMLSGWEARKIERTMKRTATHTEYVFIDPVDGTHYCDDAIGDKAQELLGMSWEERHGAVGKGPVLCEDLFMELYEGDALDRFRSLLGGEGDLCDNP